MSKSKSKPKRVKYVTAASYEILSDERDALEGALTDVEQDRDALKADRDNLSKFAASKAGHLRELETNYHHLAVRFRQMCEYRDQWATQSAVWEEKAKQLEPYQISYEKMLVAWHRQSVMLDVVGNALETAQFEFELSQHFVKSWADHAKWLVDELKRAKRNVFSKLWHWFWGEPKDAQ